MRNRAVLVTADHSAERATVHRTRGDRRSEKSFFCLSVTFQGVVHL